MRVKFPIPTLRAELIPGVEYEMIPKFFIDQDGVYFMVEEANNNHRYIIMLQDLINYIHDSQT